MHDCGMPRIFWGLIVGIDTYTKNCSERLDDLKASTTNDARSSCIQIWRVTRIAPRCGRVPDTVLLSHCDATESVSVYDRSS